MGRDFLRNSDGDLVIIEQGEAATLTATLTDATGANLATASVLTLTATLVNASDGAVINSRNAQSILNANGGTLADDGDGNATLTFRMTASDATNEGTTVGDLESHYLLIIWTWQDDQSTTQTGKHEWELLIRPLTTPVP